MLFEVLFDGKVRASTSYLECIPTKNTLPDMEHASDLFTCDRLTGSTAGKNMFYNCNSLVGGNGTKYADKADHCLSKNIGLQQLFFIHNAFFRCSIAICRKLHNPKSRGVYLSTG